MIQYLFTSFCDIITIIVYRGWLISIETEIKQFIVPANGFSKGILHMGQRQRQQ